MGPSLLIQAPVDRAALGTAVNRFLAADGPAIERDERLGLAAGALERWSVQSAIHADALVGASDAVRAWCERRWPSATWHREWPVRLRQDDGTELIGFADMVVMGEESFVLIDHKCLSGTREEALESAAGYAGQIWTYAEAVAAATGKRAEGCFVHLIAQGCAVSVTKPAVWRLRHPAPAASSRVARAAHAAIPPVDARPEPDFNLEAGSGGHVHERIETEELDSAAHEVADPRLGHAEEGCRLTLRQSFGCDELLQTERQERAQLEGNGFLSGEPKVLEDVAARRFDG